MKQFYPRLIIENCQDAIGFYQSILSGEVKNVQLADGKEMFKGHEGKYIHAELHFGDGYAMYFNDVFGGEPATGTAIQLGLILDSQEEIDRIYNALSDGGQVSMELQDTFWGARYGKLIDKYGIHWELNYQK